jgi:hypothetical protein
LLLRFEVENWQVLVKHPHFMSECRNNCRGISYRPHLEGHLPFWVVRKIDSGWGFTSQTDIFCVFNHAHNFILSPVLRSPTKMLTHRVLVIEILVYHRFIDHGNFWWSFAIPGTKVAAQQ